MRLREKARCKVEKSQSCYPLKKDPICRSCYDETMLKQEQETKDGKQTD